jgi:biotin-dependent carboxylase-like uncharacterized protein
LSLEVENPGVLTTIQDWGRYGQRMNGYATGGALDEVAYLWAQRLLDNPYTAPMLEITMPPAQFVVRSPTRIVMTGADVAVRINDQAVALWHSIPVQAGDRIAIDAPRQGLRVYLAVQGGFDVPQMHGSASTVLREGSGYALHRGDSIAYQSEIRRERRSVNPEYIPNYSSELVLGVIPGFQYAGFSKEAQHRLWSEIYTLTPQMDRMGCRLQGAALEYEGDELLSEGVIPGSVQISHDGMPIILQKDCQTLGGYPKVGVVDRLSLNKLAQARAGDTVRFLLTDCNEARRKLMEVYRFFGVKEKQTELTPIFDG